MDGTAIFDVPTWGGPFNPYNVTQTHLIFVKLQENTFFRHAKGKSNFLHCQCPKSKMAMFEQLNDQLLFSELKIKFYPSLDRSWCEFFGL